MSGVYNNSDRDLVDAFSNDKDVLRRVKSEELPDELQKLTDAERETVVKEVATKRAALQRQIDELSKERDAYLAKEQKRLTEISGEATLGDAVVTTIQRQLEKSGFEQPHSAE